MKIVSALAALAMLAVSGGALAQQVQVYELPPGAKPHDVAPAPDGRVWYTGQRHGTLGILDPSTGAVRELADGHPALHSGEDIEDCPACARDQ